MNPSLSTSVTAMERNDDLGNIGLEEIAEDPTDGGSGLLTGVFPFIDFLLASVREARGRHSFGREKESRRKGDMQTLTAALDSERPGFVPLPRGHIQSKNGSAA